MSVANLRYKVRKNSKFHYIRQGNFFHEICQYGYQKILKEAQIPKMLTYLGEKRKKKLFQKKEKFWDLAPCVKKKTVYSKSLAFCH
jgi:hypothetical protein